MQYTIITKTGNVPDAGTTANVFLTLHGAQAESGEIALTSKEVSADPFCRNQLGVFEVSALGVIYIVVALLSSLRLPW